MIVTEVESGPIPVYMVKLSLDEDIALSRIAGAGESRAKALKDFLDLMLDQTTNVNLTQLIEFVIEFEKTGLGWCPLCEVTHFEHEIAELVDLIKDHKKGLRKHCPVCEHKTETPDA